MRKALFVHGFNSDEHSSTGSKVGEVLKDLGFSTVLKTFDVLSPIKTKAEIENLLNGADFDLVLGHSLGGFYTFVADVGIKKILINPSLRPEEDLKPVSTLDPKILDDFAKLNQEKVSNIQKTEAKDIFSLFGKRDELLSHIPLFAKYYGNNYKVLDCTHRPDTESLKLGLPIALQYLGFQDL